MIESREGCGPLKLTRRRRGRIPLRTTLSQIPLKSCGFPGAESARKRFFLRGASSPPKKSARSRRTGRRDRLEVERVHTLSSSPGLFWREFWFPTMRGAILLKAFVSDDAGRGALRSPTPPRVTGCERVHTLSRSPGAVLVGSLVSDDAGVVLLTAFVSDNAGLFF